MLSSFKIAALACAAVITVAVPVKASDLAAHRAVYGVSLGENRDATGLNTVSGNIAYGVEKVCDGWLLAQSGTMNMHLPSGAVASQQLHYSSWEADDGSTYRFTVTTEGDGQDVILGDAEIQPGQKGVARYRRPEPLEYELPPGTLFPVSHTLFMIEAARAGKTQVQSHIFEGTEVEGAKLLVVFISPMSKTARDVVNEVGGGVLGRPGWNFRLAYFDPADQSGQPLYEIEADMLDNGVAPRWVLDYGAFTVEMKISKIEGLPRPDC